MDRAASTCSSSNRFWVKLENKVARWLVESKQSLWFELQEEMREVLREYSDALTER